MYINYLNFDVHFTYVYHFFKVWYTFHSCISIIWILIYILHMYINFLNYDIHFTYVYWFFEFDIHLKYVYHFFNFDIHFTYVYQFFCKLIYILHVYINIRSLNSSYLGYLSYNMKFSCLNGNYLTNERILSEIGKWSIL